MQRSWKKYVLDPSHKGVQYHVAYMKQILQTSRPSGGYDYRITCTTERTVGYRCQWPIEFSLSHRLTGQLIVVETQARQVRQLSYGVWNRT